MPRPWPPVLGISSLWPCWLSSVSGPTQSKVKSAPRSCAILPYGHWVACVAHKIKRRCSCSINDFSVPLTLHHAFFFVLADSEPFVLYLVDLFLVCLIPLWVFITSKHPASQILLRTGWEPIITAMVISRCSQVFLIYCMLRMMFIEFISWAHITDFQQQILFNEVGKNESHNESDFANHLLSYAGNEIYIFKEEYNVVVLIVKYLFIEFNAQFLCLCR